MSHTVTMSQCLPKLYFSFLAIGIGLTFLTLGLTGMLGSDDILACFIVGNGKLGTKDVFLDDANVFL